jgi:diguanylate cyclase (GGDEF)-like protein
VSTNRAAASGAGHLIFLWAVGLAGWCLLAAVGPGVGAWPDPIGAALFLLVVAGVRAFAFPLPGLDGEADVSLDSAIFIAATACLGARVTSVGVGIILGADALVRALRAEPRVARASVIVRVAGAAVYAGGLSAGLLALMARAFHVGDRPGGGETVVRVVALGLTFLVTHYLLQTVQLKLGGRSFRAALKRNAFGVLSEATLLPLAATIVLIWNPHRPIPFAMLGGTYLLVNYGFQRLAKMASAMRRRAIELEALNRTAHALGSSLEVSELMQALLKETARALPGATRLAVLVSRPAAEVQKFQLDVDGRMHARLAGEDTRRWLKLKEPVADSTDDAWARSRLVVPMLMYGETIGALVAESALPDAFGPDERRLLDAIGGQAASAVEKARLYALANVDGLTGLYCRRYFDIRITEEIERARRFDTSFCLILMDLDDFKHLNDTLGHLLGDRALREVAAISASQLRGVDLAARYGGEEMAFLLPRTSLGDAHAVAERIREAVASHTIGENGRNLRITASLGVAGWTESGVDDMTSLVARADAALYRAKAAGKNRVEVDVVPFELSPSLAPIRRRRQQA